jgi:predicted RNase H-like nuclease
VKALAIGLDGARKGWVAAVLRGESLSESSDWKTELRLLAGIDEVGELREGDERLPTAIDIPIGLPPMTGFRACDKEARVLLGARRNSVFAAPGRDVLELAAYPDVQAAAAIAKATDPGANGLSKQSWALVPKIREVDAWVRAEEARKESILECHPELSFRALAGGTALVSKRTVPGAVKRLSLVRGSFPDAEAALLGFDESGADLSDALDAFAALSSALRHGREESEELGGGERDDCDLPMRMVI